MTEGTPVAPVQAATVILVRPNDGSWQCFMVRRHIKSDFAADVFVFPGGKVDAADRATDMREYVDGENAYKPSGLDTETWRALCLAAIRELFEEAGVLLARRQEEEGFVRLDGEAASRFATYRQQLHAGTLSLAELAREEGLRLHVSLLRPISRWITPEVMTRRFDTYFFVAHLPERQVPVHEGIETTDSIWIAPPEALQRAHRGEFPLVFATEKHLERLAGYTEVEDMLAAVTGKDLDPVMPKIVQQDGATHFLLPGDHGY